MEEIAKEKGSLPLDPNVADQALLSRAQRLIQALNAQGSFLSTPVDQGLEQAIAAALLVVDGNQVSGTVAG